MDRREFIKIFGCTIAVSSLLPHLAIADALDQSTPEHKLVGYMMAKLSLVEALEMCKLHIYNTENDFSACHIYSFKDRNPQFLPWAKMQRDIPANRRQWEYRKVHFNKAVVEQNYKIGLLYRELCNRYNIAYRLSDPEKQYGGELAHINENFTDPDFVCDMKTCKHIKERVDV